jgi:hypothetical protein
VNLWSWKAEAEGGGPPNMDSVYQSMHTDAWTFTNYSTAVSAGNVISQPHQTPVEDANAAGFGSFRSQPLKQQNVQGKGIWHDGFGAWFVRDLKSKDADDVKLVAGKPAGRVRHLERRAARSQRSQDGQQLVSTHSRRRQGQRHQTLTTIQRTTP